MLLYHDDNFEKNKGMRKEKTDRDSDLEVSGKSVFWPENYLRNLSSFVSWELHVWRILRTL
jgi:hypothetical protein